MSEQVTTKKLAELSFDDLYVEKKVEVFPEIRMAVGRAYANIHRSSHRMPESLQVRTSALTEQVSETPQATFSLPVMKQF